MAQDATKPAKGSSPVKTGYLILYNALSAVLWATVLGRTLGTNFIRGPEFVYISTGNFVLWTQTLMILDVLHGLFGIVRSDPITAAMQVASRYVAVWGVQYPFPALCSSPIYSSMLFAWSLTEVIRYSYLGLKLAGWEPYPFFWVRYSSYRILYPIGILSEMGMMYLALGPAGQKYGQLYQLYLLACLCIIWPAGAYILIGHMERQRRKVLRAAKEQNVKATQ
ncbi:tyrosine phosphatase-like protein [Truncatella angustata]|uniref:Very-long-chain (3R)-3-hydroxyacyl-CoA dehydratase n=1 Tax=Truncatella angustata TaxID=152316 RepID=A0A9P8ULW0_9PEZI|nr:tyrosine phosphatase-like protein [Truncatella angustata]KAH6654466.1 tyrosine phosphatase-like protein [Truncatella angustata]